MCVRLFKRNLKIANCPEGVSYLCILNLIHLCRMISLRAFTFNPFSENTYVVWDGSRKALIIDPGMSDASEERELSDFIDDEGLTPVWLVNTHAHLDHVLGNDFVKKQYDVPFVAHRKAVDTLRMASTAAQLYGIPYKGSPEPDQFIEEGEKLHFGKSTFDILFVPGHAPGHIALVNHASKTVIAGDVLFDGSVGRVDLPGGDGALLRDSIQQKMYALPDEFTVYCGHGPATTIGKEKESNPFVSATRSVW